MTKQILTYTNVEEKFYPPQRASELAAGFDLCAIDTHYLNPGERALIKTGLSIKIPDGWCGMVCPRSGLAIRHGVTVLNAPGIVDADYRGDVGVILINLGERTFMVTHGDRVAQLVIVPACYHNIGFQHVSDLDDTVRGTAGFGSTGT